jgi:uncharacterized membrane protein YoaK (UPF0700 family)
MKPSLAAVLSLNGGYVDTAGFIALQGLFTAHVTGNFVTIGSALVFGTSGVIAKLLALPVFCLVIIGTRLASFHLPHNSTALNTMLIVKLALLVMGAYFAIHWGPFPNGDSWAALITGMTFVSAMAIQNAIHRIHLGTAPPTTLMTGTTTQIMIDLADAIRGLSPDTRTATLTRMRRMVTAVILFALGAAAAALFFKLAGVVCFLVPPMVAIAAIAVATPADSTPPLASPTSAKPR